MGKFVYIYSRDQHDWQKQKRIIEMCLRVPENNPQTHQSESEFLWVSNPNDFAIDKFSLAGGVLNFNLPINEIRHFAFRLLNREEVVTIESDHTASRTIWYILDRERFIASSSQRAIIALLQNLDFNIQAISWMLCTGCLGPANSWDSRISNVTPNTRVSFNKCLGKFEIAQTSKKEESLMELDEIFERVFSEFIATDHWGITLSGGVDSRVVLYHLKKHKIGVESFTWGLEKSLLDPQSDASVAKEIARYFNTPFAFLDLEKTSFDARGILDNFLAFGEGRVDHINSFIDGLANWKLLSKKNIRGIVRSDELFGWLAVENERDVRESLDLNLPEDHKILKSLFEASNTLEVPYWPVNFNKSENESLSDWRDRLYRSYRIPYILAALQDPLSTYFDIANPLLDKYFVDWVMRQTENDRTNKKKFGTYAKKFMAHFPIAKKPSIPEPDEIVLQDSFRKEIDSVLRSTEAAEIFEKKFISILLDIKETHSKKSTFFRVVAGIVPFRLKKMMRKTILPYELKHGRLLLRAYIVVAMKKIIQEDIVKAKKIISG